MNLDHSILTLILLAPLVGAGVLALGGRYRDCSSLQHQTRPPQGAV